MIRHLAILLIFLPSLAFAGGFFEREATQQMDNWRPVNSDGLWAMAFPEGEDEEAIELASFTSASERRVAGSDKEYRIEINLPARKLSLYKGGAILKTYSVAIGALGHKTPVGPGRISDVTWNPWWYPPTHSAWAKNAKKTPPGPGNPLGPAKMPLGGDIVLHGTNKESSVGQAASHGCMRMKNRDVRELAWFFQTHFSNQTDAALAEKYRQHPRETYTVKLNRQIPVRVIYDRVAVRDNEVEIYPDIYGRGMNPWEKVLTELEKIGVRAWDVDPLRLREFQMSGETVKIPIRELLVASTI